MKESEFRQLLAAHWPELSPGSVENVVDFYLLMVQENQVQNLTRLIEPADFVFGHVMDVRELLKLGFLKYPAMDLGSGCGVPGLLAALVSDGSWVLAEAEGRKAEFLMKAAEQCRVVDRVRVHRGRAEDYLKTESVETIVARAVGPVERIFGWIRDCSTWNNLVLLKGPGWADEWNEFLSGRNRKKLVIKSAYEYSIGPENKSRIIVELARVPRGT